MKKPNLKQSSMGIAVLVLVLLNVLYYGESSEPSPVVYRQMASVDALELPPILMQSRQYNFHRDIFSYLEELDESSDDRAIALEEAVVSEALAPRHEEVVEAPPDFVVKGILKRNGRYVAMLEYQGKKKVVKVGDSLDHRYFVEHISNSKVHVSTRKP